MTEKLSAGDLCTRIVTITDRDMSVVEAAQLMRDHHVGCLVVTDDSPHGRLVVGLLTDRDIVTAVVAEEIDPMQIQVEAVMTREVVTAAETDSVSDLLDKMRRKGLRRLPVVTRAGVLVGLVTLDDLLTVMAEQLRAMALSIEAGQMRERKLRP